MKQTAKKQGKKRYYATGKAVKSASNWTVEGDRVRVRVNGVWFTVIS